jgi:hypothetical protein
MSGFEEILSEYDEQVRDWADTLRFIITGLAPDLVEIPDPAGHLIAYGRSEHMADIVFTIIPQQGYVNLGIVNAVGLSDPEGLLEGTGKRHRHIKIRGEEDLTRAGLHALLTQAISR